MPIKIPNGLPAADILASEGVSVMSEATASRQDIRPLQIGLLNLMPNKAQTETQFARLIGATPLQIELTLVRMSDHRSKHTPPEHLEAFYQPWAALRERRFDGFIVTGAPVERLDFEDVTYWGELREIFDWTDRCCTSVFAICWGAQAMLRHFHGTPKHALPQKAFGCFRHKAVAPTHPLLRGFSDNFVVPVSRWTETRREDLGDALEVLADGEVTGPCLVADRRRRAFYMFNHIEYDTGSLGDEYARDAAVQDPTRRVGPPTGYFPDDDPTRPPENRWRGHAHLLFANWINFVYQTTPFELSEIGSGPTAPAL